jgi:hypothetical protein
MSNLFRLFYFNSGVLVNSNTVNKRQLDNSMQSFMDLLSVENSDNLAIDVYSNSIILENKNKHMNIKLNSIELFESRHKVEEVKVNWLAEVNNSLYYSEEEMLLIQENIEAMQNFEPSEDAVEFSFPNEIPEKFKEVQSKETELYLVETIEPLYSL